MGTRSTISILKEDKSIEQIYCHWDGYFEHNGFLLQAYYKDKEKIKKLINYGDLSSLYKNIEPENKHNFQNPEKDVCVFYMRDRGDIGCEARKYKNFEEFLKNGSFEEFDYVFKEKNSKWYYLENNKLKPLLPKLKGHTDYHIIEDGLMKEKIIKEKKILDKQINEISPDVSTTKKLKL